MGEIDWNRHRGSEQAFHGGLHDPTHPFWADCKPTSRRYHEHPWFYGVRACADRYSSPPEPLQKGAWYVPLQKHTWIELGLALCQKTYADALRDLLREGRALPEQKNVA